MDERTIDEAILKEKNNPGFFVDKEQKRMEIPFSKGMTEEDIDMIMSGCMKGSWYAEKGFQVDFVTKDVEYMPKASWLNYCGRKAYLRNRLVMIVTWE